MPEGQYVRSWQEFQLFPGVPDAIAALNRAGIKVIVVSNQRGIALGRYTTADVDAIHNGLQKLLAASGAHVDGFYICPHDIGQCDCRKPLTGLFERARAEFPETDAQTSVMVGDSLSDIEFGRRAGMRTVFVKDLSEARLADSEQAERIADFSCDSLQSAVNLILRDGA